MFQRGEDMISKKRDAIMESVLKLLDERPLNRISVKDIVEDCGISRNTFYYHFEDIPTLIEAIVIDEVNRIMNTYVDISSMEECFDAAMQFCVGHRRAVYHLYNSANKDILEKSLMQICEHVVTQFVDHAAKGMDIRPEDRRIIIRSYKCECFGHFIDWLNSGMDDRADQRFLRLCELRRGSTATMLERSRVV